ADDDIRPVHVILEVLEGYRSAFEYLREFHGAFKRPVRDEDRRYSRAPQMLRRELSHLAGANDHHDFARQGAEDLPGQLDRGIAARTRRLRDARFAAHTLGDSKRAAHQRAEIHADCAGIAGDAVRFLHLPQNLRLTDHHGVEARCNAEDVADRISIPEA